MKLKSYNKDKKDESNQYFGGKTIYTHPTCENRPMARMIFSKILDRVSFLYREKVCGKTDQQFEDLFREQYLVIKKIASIDTLNEYSVDELITCAGILVVWIEDACYRKSVKKGIIK